jgi:hypothetical protein
MHISAALVCCLLAADPRAPDAAPSATDTLVLTGALPFSSQELEQAIALRLFDGSTWPGKLEVIAQGADRIEVRLGGRRRIVEIGSSREDMVTRLVAISVADLLMETTPAPLRLVSPALPPAREATLPPLRLAVMPGLAHGLARGETALYSLVAGFGARRGRVVVGLDAGYWHTPTVRAGQPGESTMAAWPVRVSAGAALGRFEFSLGPVVAPYNVTGTMPRSGVLVGGGPAALLALPLLRGLRGVAAGGCDVFVNRTATTVGGKDLTFASPRVAPWVGLGLAWEIGA